MEASFVQLPPSVFIGLQRLSKVLRGQSRLESGTYRRTYLHVFSSFLELDEAMLPCWAQQGDICVINICLEVYALQPMDMK